MRKIRQFLLTMAMVLGSAPAMWAQTFEIGGLKYTVTDGNNVSVAKGTDALEKNLVIPATVKYPENSENEYTVTSIPANGFSGCAEMTSIVVPSTVTSIGLAAFSGCSALESITLPFVGDKAHTEDDPSQYPFGYIFGTSSYTGGTQTPQNYMFYSFGSLGVRTTNYYIPTTLKSVVITGGSYIQYGAFSNCAGLTNISIPSSIKSIEEAFSGCSDLTSFYEYDNAKYLGNSESKYLCLYEVLSTDITSCEINSNCKVIYYQSFSGCNKLEEIVIPDGVTDIGAAAFSGCSSMTSINIPDGVTKIKNLLFKSCSSLESLTIPNGVTNIGREAFYCCTSLTSVNIPNGVDIINNQTFYNCSKLSSIIIPESVTNIEYEAFCDCSGLKYLIIPDGVNNIGKRAFSGYQGDALKCIIYSGNASGGNWGALTRGVSLDNDGFVYADPEKTQLSAYIGDAQNVDIPSTVKSIGHHAFRDCAELTSVTFHEGITSIDSYELFRNCSKLASITIPECVTIIDDGAFFGCSSLTSIDIPNSVTRIGQGAFQNCTGLTSINIGNSVTSIDGRAFRNCGKLTKITIPESVTYISSQAFEMSSNIVYNKDEDDNALYLGNESNPFLWLISKKSTSIITCNINSNCKYICEMAFYKCNKLTTINIPNSIEGIGEYAFSGCTNLQCFEDDYACYLGNSTNNYLCLYKAKSNDISSCEIQNSCEFIHTSALADCSNLTSVSIPNGIKSIGTSAFSNCSSLQSLTIPKTIEKMGDGGILYNSNNATIYTDAETNNWGNSWNSNCPVKLNCKVIQVFVDNNEHGTIEATSYAVKATDGSLWYLNNTQVTLTAAPKTGYHVIWEDNSTENTITFTPAESRTYTATFEAHADRVVFENILPATCTTAGSYDSVVYCTVCNAEVSRDKKYVAALGHAYDTVAVAATCTDDGYKELTCSRCNHVEHIEPVPTAGHKADSVVFENIVEATCTEAGSKDSVVYCTVCKEELSRKTVEIEATGHKADSVVFENIVAATCTAAGSKDSVVYCSVCKAEVSRTKVTLPATGHTVVVDSAVAATATTDGLTEGSHCSVCGETIVAQEVIPATGEQGGEGNGNEGGNENQGGNNQGGNENQGGENTEPATAIADDAAPAVNIYAYQNIIVVENATDEIYVYNAMGTLVYRDAARHISTTATITVNGQGVYIVKTGNVAKRVMIY